MRPSAKLHLTHLQCALTKLSYLLSKESLDPDKVRELIGKPIRGELTRRAHSAATPPANPSHTQHVELLLTEAVRLSAPSGSAPGLPNILVSSATEDAVAADDDTAPWGSTAGEAAAAQAALLPLLVHMAAARDDLSGIAFCLHAAEPSAAIAEVEVGRAIPGGIVNCVESASGRAPLHTAALNGCAKSVEMLLVAGALVHLRDALGHTALYYVRHSVVAWDDWLTVRL
jgi:lysophospholipase